MGVSRWKSCCGTFEGAKPGRYAVPGHASHPEITLKITRSASRRWQSPSIAASPPQIFHVRVTCEWLRETTASGMEGTPPPAVRRGVGALLREIEEARADSPVMKPCRRQGWLPKRGMDQIAHSRYHLELFGSSCTQSDNEAS